MPYLRIIAGTNAGRVVEVGEEVVTLGRDESQTVQILDQGVSRAHAEVFRIGDMCFVRDLESTNGSFVNSKRVGEDVLQDRDELKIGSTTLRFELQPQADGGAGARSEGDAINLGKKARESQEPEAPMHSQERLSRAISAGAQIAGIFQGEEDIEVVLGKALDLLIRLMEASQCFLLRYDPRSGKATVRAFTEAEDFAGPRKVSRTILRQVVQTNRPLLSTNAAVDERFSLSESVVLQKIHSVICAPVTATPSEFLLLYAHLDSPERSFTADDLDLAAAVSVQVGMALLSHRRFQHRAVSLHHALDCLVRALESRDPRQVEHGRRVATAARAIATQLDLDQEDLETVSVAGLIHDFGKSVSDSRRKEAHIEAARAFLDPVAELKAVAEAVAHHHERADGSGYPQKLMNEQMPVTSRVVIVANAFDNLLTGEGADARPVDLRGAVKVLAQRGGTEFDDEVIKALLASHRNGTLVGKPS